MPVQVTQLLEIIDELCPFSLAEPWDNVGLQLGATGATVESVLLTLDITGDAIDEAIALSCGALLTHHPLIFEPLTAVTDGSAAGALLQQAARVELAVIAAHTNLDSATGGLADKLSQLLEFGNTQPLEGSRPGLSKLVTFLPEDDLERVRSALFGAGAGIIGDYSHCSYYTAGKGTFLPGEAADPSIGKVGRDETVDELRLEMVFPPEKTRGIVAALRGAHSYEEPAYDIYPLETMCHDSGSGRAGELPAECSLEEFARHVAGAFGLETARYSGEKDSRLTRAAIVPGSGAAHIKACADVADVLVTGDIKYHDQLLAAELGLALVDIPHECSENRALELWQPDLRNALEPLGVALELSRAEAPVSWRASAPGASRGLKKDVGEGDSSRDGSGKAANGKDMGMYKLHVDGGSRGNPGPAGIGAVLTDVEENTVATVSEFIGEATNNIAEYSAMVAGLKLALDKGIRRLDIYSDSELIVRQLQGSYKVKNEGLRSYYQQAISLLGELEAYELSSVPREANAQADELVNRALDESGH